MRIRNVEDVASWRLCLGCGACEYGCTEGKVKLLDVINEGIRPLITDECGDCRECLEYCPGIEMAHGPFDKTDFIEELKSGWGPVLELWEGFATDTDLRFRGSSGGVASALALYCLENEGMHGVLHTGADDREPWRNKTVFSKNKKALISRAGSRYSPASPCDGLKQIEDAPSPCVFIGKPCDVSGLRKASKKKPLLRNNTGLAISIFCAGTPSSLGTIELLKKFKIQPPEVAELRYRGNGWPGMYSVKLKKETAPKLQMTYKESWSFLQKYRPLRCYLCPDGTGEFADISCGDPWYREIEAGEQGQSLVVVRTERGRRVLEAAIEAGYVELKRTGPKILRNSQANLLEKRSTIWGRILALRLFLLPAPELKGFSLFYNWKTLPFKEKAKSIIGTARRIIQRQYRKKIKYT